MTTQVAFRGRGLRHVRRSTSDGGPPDPAALVTALVAALEGALLAARGLLDALDAAACHAPAMRGMGGTARADGLSPREREVLRLLATGHSNRRIAAALCLSPRTVQRHVANIYLKVGAHCRAEATAYALRQHRCPGRLLHPQPDPGSPAPRLPENHVG